MEDTDIKPNHIEQIKELIKKEVILEEGSLETRQEGSDRDITSST